MTRRSVPIQPNETVRTSNDSADDIGRISVGSGSTSSNGRSSHNSRASSHSSGHSSGHDSSSPIIPTADALNLPLNAVVSDIVVSVDPRVLLRDTELPKPLPAHLVHLAEPAKIAPTSSNEALLNEIASHDHESHELSSHGHESISHSNQNQILGLATKRTWLQFRTKLFSFIGPGFIISVAYLDPGNWSTDLAGGSSFGYKLLSIIFISNLMAMLLQSYCVRLGVISGKDLAQCCRKYFPKYASLTLYVLAELAIIATDLAEVIGSAIALNLLFQIPLTYGVLITGFDVILVMMGIGGKWLEAFVALLVAIIGTSVFTVVAKSAVVWKDVAWGFVPPTDILTSPALLYLAVSIIGATVMPHNLYLHSAIVRQKQDMDVDEVLEMTQYDSIIALTLALFINIGILIIAAANFYPNGVAELKDAFVLLGRLGGWVSIVFAAGLLVAGQSGAITGTLAGQIVMDGFLGLGRGKPWMRRLATRLVAIVPALVTVIVGGETMLNRLLVLSQIGLSLQLPFAVWPLIWFTSRREVMGDYLNGWIRMGLGMLIGGLVTMFNIVLVYQIAAGMG